MNIGAKRATNMTFTNGNKLISLTVDNGASTDFEPRSGTMTRADMRCFSGDNDITSKVFSSETDNDYDIVMGTVENMAKAISWLQLSSDPYSGG